MELFDLLTVINILFKCGRILSIHTGSRRVTGLGTRLRIRSSNTNDSSRSKGSSKSKTKCGSKACAKRTSKFNKAITMRIDMGGKGVRTMRIASTRGRSDTCLTVTRSVVPGVVRTRDTRISAVDNTAFDSAKVGGTTRRTLRRTMG